MQSGTPGLGRHWLVIVGFTCAASIGVAWWRGYNPDDDKTRQEFTRLISGARDNGESEKLADEYARRIHNPGKLLKLVLLCEERIRDPLPKGHNTSIYSGAWVSCVLQLGWTGKAEAAEALVTLLTTHERDGGDKEFIFHALRYCDRSALPSLRKIRGRDQAAAQRVIKDIEDGVEY